MGNKKSSIAKIARPKLAGIFPRERLFKHLDRGRNRPVVWVGAPAGSGKTTLVASWLDARKLPCLWYQVDAGDGDIASFFYYLGLAAMRAAPRYKKPLPLLTPEYLLGIPVFTRRYFEKLFARLKPSTTVVFDGYQNAPLQSDFHEMIAHALDVVPEEMNVVIISRGEPPAEFARLKANSKIRMLGWEDVRFTFEESCKLAGSQGARLNKDARRKLYEKTEGWAAGLVLMTAGADFGGAGAPVVSSTTLSDYFASEIFGRADSAARDILLKTSFLTMISAADAEQLTGNRSAALILENLYRQHLFTQKYDEGYQYHPLFREYLQRRAYGAFSAAEISLLQRKAARRLEESGRVDDAAGLLMDGCDWPALIKLVLSQAEALVTQGRGKTLENWILAVPEAVRSENAWLLYWSGICRIPYDPAAGRAFVEKAFHRFEIDGDRSSALLAWSVVVDAHILEWGDFQTLDSWIDWFCEQPDKFLFPTAELEARCASSMTAALVSRRPDHPDIGMWAERALNASRKVADAALKMQVCINTLFFYIWTADTANAESRVEEMAALSKGREVRPVMLITTKWMEAPIRYSRADYDAGLESVFEAMRTADEYGIHVWDHMIFGFGLQGALLKEDREMASMFLGRMKTALKPECSLGYCHYHHALSWYHAVFGDLDAALLHAERALALVVEFRGTALCYPEMIVRVGLANILCEKRRYAEAGEQLAVVFDEAIRSGNKMIEFMHGMTRARVAFAQGRHADGSDVLRSAMQLGRQNDYVGMSWWWQRPVMSELCGRALEAGIEAEYARRIIMAHRLAPGEGAVFEQWPYPLRITTLGRFEVQKDGKPLPFAGRKKQLDLLKILVCLGGIAVREEQVTGLLWPDAEGDDAHNSFKMTLSRLRGMIGNDALVHEEGSYSLNASVVRTDADDFEQRCRTALGLWEQAGGSKDGIAAAAGATEQALALYQGAFLPDDAPSAWTVSTRERLRSRFLRLMIAAGRQYESKGKWKTAAEHYEKGLEADPLREEFYQRLMLCHLKLGRRAEAVAVYERCRSELSALGVKPSTVTESLLLELRR